MPVDVDREFLRPQQVKQGGTDQSYRPIRKRTNNIRNRIPIRVYASECGQQCRIEQGSPPETGEEPDILQPSLIWLAPDFIQPAAAFKCRAGPGECRCHLRLGQPTRRLYIDNLRSFISDQQKIWNMLALNTTAHPRQ